MTKHAHYFKCIYLVILTLTLQDRVAAQRYSTHLECEMSQIQEPAFPVKGPQEEK